MTETINIPWYVRLDVPDIEVLLDDLAHAGANRVVQNTNGISWQKAYELAKEFIAECKDGFVSEGILECMDDLRLPEGFEKLRTYTFLAVWYEHFGKEFPEE